MDRDSNFFWLCIRDAAAGTLYLASAIATVVGGGILWVAAWLGGLKLEAVTSLVGPMGFDVLLAIASLLASWIAVFLLRLGGAPARLYWKGQKKIKDLENEILESNERLVPKINVLLNPLTGGVHEYPTEIAQANSPPIKGPSSKWVQFGVSCASNAPLTGCEAFLTSVTKIDGDKKGPELVEEHIHCNWS